jgi:hypothetical protein
MPTSDEFVPRHEAPSLLRQRYFRYSATTLAVYASRGEGPPVYYRKRGSKGPPIAGYLWGELHAWAIEREKRLRPNSLAARYHVPTPDRGYIISALSA